MGAFFLYRVDSKLLLDDASRVFECKGFGQRRQFELKDWVLWHYPKQLVDTPNYSVEEDGSAVFCYGTVVYRRLGYEPSLKRLLHDFRQDRLELDELLGNFCLLFWDGRVLSLLTDRLNVQHVFFNEERTCFSSSLLAVLAASPRPLALNPLAAYEMLSTGYIISPDTLVKGIYSLNSDLKASINSAENDIKFILHRPKPTLRDFHKDGLEDSVERQLSVLQTYFKSIDRLHREYGGELGLSGGYDGRLILALSRHLSKPVGLHTHHTLGFHDRERKIAERLAAIYGSEITVVPTKPMEDHDENRLREILWDNLYLFDARCAYSVGAFGETYTPNYRKRTLADNRLGLNGLGGEILRNSYFSPLSRFPWSAWLDCNVYYPFAKEVVGSQERWREVREHVLSKMESYLQMALSGKADMHTAHTYYGYLRMPECAGNVNNAYNQISFFLTPFIETTVISEALKAIAFIGANGCYQAELIKRSAPHLAEIVSHYGFNFSKVSARHMIKSKVKAAMPLRLRHYRERYLLVRHSRSPSFQRFSNFLSKSRAMQEIQEALSDFFSGADWQKAMLHFAQRRATIFLGSFFVEFSHKLRV